MSARSGERDLTTGGSQLKRGHRANSGCQKSWERCKFFVGTLDPVQACGPAGAALTSTQCHLHFRKSCLWPCGASLSLYLEISSGCNDVKHRWVISPISSVPEKALWGQTGWVNGTKNELPESSVEFSVLHPLHVKHPFLKMKTTKFLNLTTFWHAAAKATLSWQFPCSFISPSWFIFVSTVFSPLLFVP